MLRLLLSFDAVHERDSFVIILVIRVHVALWR